MGKLVAFVIVAAIVLVVVACARASARADRIRPLHFTAEPLYEDVEPYAKIIERKEDEA